MQRKPVVYLLVILPILFFGGLALIAGLMVAYSEFKGVPRAAIPNLNGLLISVPAFLVWIPISLLLGNLILYWVPLLRPTAESYAANANRPGFAESQWLLLKVLLVFVLIFVPLVVVGFVA